MGERITSFAINRPWLVLLMALALTTVALLRINTITVDTDPENMLGEDEYVRVFHNQVKARFELSDMVILGVVNDADPDGVFNPETLAKVYSITEGAKSIEGVVTRDIMAPSTIDDILQNGPGSVRFKYLMEKPPADRAGAHQLRERITSNPMLYGTLVSEDAKALAIYVPIEKKEFAHRVSLELKELIDAQGEGSERYHITGLPVAEDTFGVEMFLQMGISAPLAGLFVFLLMLFFFRKLVLVISPMVVAMLTVGFTMGTLVSMGYTVHIMSSMIPIFLMPIAVVDSVHILSVFFDRYQKHRNREAAIHEVMGELFVPMLYTSITTMAGFASLALTPIPPVKVFGLFVALGVGVAWVLTVTVVPAYIMVFIPEKSLENFGAAGHNENELAAEGFFARFIARMGDMTQTRARGFLLLTVAVMGVSAYGITLISINDNPVKWFVSDHPIREADRVLNAHFGGTYGAYLVLEPGDGAARLEGANEKLGSYLATAAADAEREDVAGALTVLEEKLRTLNAEASKAEKPDPAALADGLLEEIDLMFSRAGDAEGAYLDALDGIAEEVEAQRLSLQTFKSPEVLRYVEQLQKDMAEDPLVGKSNSLADLVKKVYQELMGGDPQYFKIPETPAAVAQAVISFQSSHNPEDVFHLVTSDFSTLNIWVQLKSGDNRDMESVVEWVDDYFTANPPPVGLAHEWAGLTYLNVVWQDKMVSGMLNSLLGSFVIVLLLMAFLFRSIVWGVISMIPLSVTIAFIYGLIGLVGKDYDMPVAVLSSLTLGMSVDFAIHYIERARELTSEKGSWREAALLMSHAPARAITRNAIVIAIGFTPLLFSNLVPYKTVGFFLATIMAVSGGATLIILPSLMKVFQGYLFREKYEALVSED